MKYFNLILILFGQIIFAQNLSNNLSGEYETKAKDTLYPYLIFDGNGMVDISGYKSYPFFERNDSVIILVDKSPFVLKKNKEELIGITDWIEGNKYKSKSKNKSTSTSNLETATLYSTFYDVNYTRTKSLFDDNLSENDLQKIMNNLFTENEKLCNKNLDIACVQTFSLKLTEDIGGIESALSLSEDFEMKPNVYFENLGNKIISLGNAEGYGLLATYYTLIRDKEKTDKILEKGLEEGCEMCLTISLQNMEE